METNEIELLKAAIRDANEQLIEAEGISLLRLYNEKAAEPSPHLKVLQAVLGVNA